MENFEVAGGTVTGRRHRKPGKNNQDAFIFENNKNSIIALVSDGCGCVEYSEFGSRLLVGITLKIIKEHIFLLEHLVAGAQDESIFWELIKEKIINKLSLVVNMLGYETKELVSKYFLATIVGFIVTEKQTFVFSIGDGEAFVNGRLIKSGDFPQNAPPYLAYALLKKFERPFEEKHLSFAIDQKIKTKELESLIIATDGIQDLRQAEDKNIPGKSERVGPIKDWWWEDKFFENSDMIRRRLFLINSDVAKIKRDEKKQMIGLNKTNGLLQDDTTLVVLRKKRKGGGKSESKSK